MVRVMKPLIPPASPYAIDGISFNSGSYPTIFTRASSTHHTSTHHTAASVDLRTLVNWLFHEPGRITATTVSPYRDLEHGTVFLLTFEHQTFQSKHSDIN